jgi:HPt (histidine-containing phosphotransfer) domain-containing protein
MSPDQQLEEKLQATFAKYRPQMLERLDLLASALTENVSGSLTAERRQLAQKAAHNLSGSLGTFGMRHASFELQRMELLFEIGKAPELRDIERMTQTLAAIRKQVEASPTRS